MQVLPWILDVGYTVIFVAIMLAIMGHVLFGEFEVTMKSLAASVSGDITAQSCVMHLAPDLAHVEFNAFITGVNFQAPRTH